MIRRLVAVAVVPVVVLVSGCSVGTPKPATYVTDISATLNAEVSSNQSGEVLYWFEYGTTTDYGEVTPDRSLTFPTGHDADDPPVVVSEPISGLDPDTTYHFRVCTSPGIEEGSRGCTNQDQSFTTGPAGGRSGIAFYSDRDGSSSVNDVFVMDTDGTDQTNLTPGPGVSATSPAFSSDGRRLAFVARGPSLDIFVMPADGGDRVNLTNNPGEDDYEPAWSPDGSKIAFSTIRDGQFEVYVMDSDGGNQTRITSNPAVDFNPAWSPDGSRIVFTSERDGNQEIYVMNADGSNPTRLTNDSAQDVAGAWSPDGRKIAFSSRRDGGQFEVYVMAADGSGPTNLTNHASWDLAPAWSPDGSKIAFNSLRDGNQELYVMDADGNNQANLTANPADDVDDSWSPRP